MVQDKVFGVAITGEILAYYLVFAAVACRLLVVAKGGELALRPRLEAIPENSFRVEALGYAPSSIARSRLAFQLARRAPEALFARWLRYVGPDTALSFRSRSTS